MRTPVVGSVAGSVAAACLWTAAAGVSADELGDMLKGGPMVRVESAPDGKFKRALCVADVEAPLDRVWAVITTQEKYPEFMPRLKRITVKPDGNGAKLVGYVLDTPFADTVYTLRVQEDGEAHTIVARHVAGDLRGSDYDWKVVAMTPTVTRIYYGGTTRNFNTMAQRLEDDQQTITVGVNVVGLAAAVKAIKARAEAGWRAAQAQEGRP